ncbi:MAG TPA: nitroreductase family protein [Blastocatellia bacterium]|nr:nitroreductase family protein [Blastocatellia bacterium]
MDTIELIKQRISTNKFDTTRTLSKAEIEELVSYATEAPSAYNIQNWRFIAVTNPEDKARLKSVAYNQQKVVDAAVTFIVLGDLRGYEKLSQILKPMVDGGHMNQAMVDGWARSAASSYGASEQFARDEAIRSASFAAMTLMIAAQAKGLATGPMIGFDPRGVKREFNIADRYVPVMLLTVGYSAPGNWPRKPRLGVDEVLAFNTGRKFEQV